MQQLGVSLNAVSLQDVFEDDHNVHMVMELCDGCARALSLSRALGTFEAVVPCGRARALMHTHARALTHTHAHTHTHNTHTHTHTRTHTHTHTRRGLLLERVESRAYSERYIAVLVRSILRFIAQCHAKGIVYRDVKPGARPPLACQPPVVAARARSCACLRMRICARVNPPCCSVAEQAAGRKKAHAQHITHALRLLPPRQLSVP